MENHNKNQNPFPKNTTTNPSDLSPLSHTVQNQENIKSIITKSTSAATSSSSSSSLGSRSPPPSDIRHVSQSPSPPQETNYTIITDNNKHSKTHSDTSSSELSPLSDLCHVSPPPTSDLRHASQSPAPTLENNNISKPSDTHLPTSAARSSSASSDLSDLCHVSPYPVFAEKARGVRSRPRESAFIARAERREKGVRKAALGFRVCGAAFCLVSLAVMAADKERGWALDSFYRYIEFRYCISVNVVGFLYSVAQTCDLAFTMCTGKYVLRHQYRFYFDFAMDQILTYLLMSSSSSAATRVDDWESNWGKDEFPMMASISVGLSFMSFVVLAASTLISGYALCTRSSS